MSLFNQITLGVFFGQILSTSFSLLVLFVLDPFDLWR